MTLEQTKLKFERNIAMATMFIDGMNKSSDTIDLCAGPISGDELAYWMLIWLDDLWYLEA